MEALNITNKKEPVWQSSAGWTNETAVSTWNSKTPHTTTDIEDEGNSKKYTLQHHKAINSHQFPTTNQYMKTTKIYPQYHK